MCTILNIPIVMAWDRFETILSSLEAGATTMKQNTKESNGMRLDTRFQAHISL